MKGHPTICLELAKRNNLKLEAFEEYVKDPTKIFNEMTLYYGEELEEHQKIGYSIFPFMEVVMKNGLKV